MEGLETRIPRNSQERQNSLLRRFAPKSHPSYCRGFHSRWPTMTFVESPRLARPLLLQIISNYRAISSFLKQKQRRSPTPVNRQILRRLTLFLPHVANPSSLGRRGFVWSVDQRYPPLIYGCWHHKFERVRPI